MPLFCPEGSTVMGPSPAMVERSSKLLHIQVHHPAIPFSDRLLRLGHGVMRRPSWPKPVAVLGERPVPPPLQFHMCDAAGRVRAPRFPLPWHSADDSCALPRRVRLGSAPACRTLGRPRSIGLACLASPSLGTRS